MTSHPPLPPADHFGKERFIEIFYAASKLPGRGRELDWLRDGRWGGLPDEVKARAVGALADFVRTGPHSDLGAEALRFLNHPQYQGLKKAVEHALGRPIPRAPARARYSRDGRPY